MTETVEVDREYLWALEVVASHAGRGPGGHGHPDDDAAFSVLRRANFKQPRDRHPDNQA